MTRGHTCAFERNRVNRREYIRVFYSIGLICPTAELVSSLICCDDVMRLRRALSKVCERDLGRRGRTTLGALRQCLLREDG